MGAMSPMHWLIVLGVLILLFGAKKLPQMARSVGQSARVFKGEMKGLREDEKATEQTTADPTELDAAPEPAVAQAAAAPQVVTPQAATSERPAA